jgi:hypothetical protein
MSFPKKVITIQTLGDTSRTIRNESWRQFLFLKDKSILQSEDSDNRVHHEAQIQLDKGFHGRPNIQMQESFINAHESFDRVAWS